MATLNEQKDDPCRDHADKDACKRGLEVLVKNPPHHAPPPPAKHEAAKYVSSKCSALGQDCRKTKCCRDPGMQCYEKTGHGKKSYWAQCKPSCHPGPDPTDIDNAPWTCKTIGHRAPGTPKKCSGKWENCLHSRCCSEGGMQCYKKNNVWAMCKASCAPNAPDMMDRDPSPWTCEALGSRKAGRAPWVAAKCSPGGADCAKTKCCQVPGMQCYEKDGNGKDSFWAQCKPTCHPGEKTNPWEKPWTCKKLGSRTPKAATDHANGGVWPWVATKCSGLYQDCSKSRCCLGVGMQCYEKKGHGAESFWGQCKQSCSTEPDPNDHNATWTCRELGTRSPGLALRGWPSLFCFSVFQVKTYEFALMKAQLKINAGIFACDGYNVLSTDDPVSLGFPPDGGPTKNKSASEVVSLRFQKVNVGTSQDGTAGNAKLFMKAWDLIIKKGEFRNYDWTLKIDPDAVLVASRLRMHLSAYAYQKVYVVNCNKFPSSPNFPMMYGALEVFSLQAMEAYAALSWKCGQQLPWKSWGEDYFMTHCMDFIGVGRISDFKSLGDKRCLGANCMDRWTAAFHDFKDIGSWMTCWKQTTR